MENTYLVAWSHVLPVLTPYIAICTTYIALKIVTCCHMCARVKYDIIKTMP